MKIGAVALLKNLMGRIYYTFEIDMKATTLFFTYDL